MNKSADLKTDLKLAYLAVTSPLPNLYIGGLMITDGRGLPLEFRYTEPIQPTKIQQILYGQVLSSYIKREVILETLLKSIESKFKCLLVEDEQLVALGPNKGFCVIRLTETKAAPLGELGKTEKISDTEVLLQSAHQASPIRLNLPDLSQNPEMASENGQPIYAILTEAGQTMDVQEPLKRIHKALEIICQEAGITSAAS